MGWEQAQRGFVPCRERSVAKIKSLMDSPKACVSEGEMFANILHSGCARMDMATNK